MPDAFTLERILTKCNGDFDSAAAVLGCNSHHITEWVQKHPVLRRTWKNRTTNPVEGPETPGKTDALMRGLNEPVVPPTEPTGDIELANLVRESDNMLLQHGLKKLGVSEEMRKRLKNLDGLAKSGGDMLAVTLEKTHRLYFLQLIGLHEVSDGIQKKLLAKAGDPEFIDDDKLRLHYQRNLTEMVRAGGEGYKLMMEGTSAMVRMMMAANGTAPGNAPTKVPLGRPKWMPVTPVEGPPDAQGQS